MKAAAKPVRTTIVLGGLGGLAFLLAGLPGVLRPWVSLGIVWGLVAVYALMLARWSRCGLPAVVFPLLVLGWAGGLVPPAGPAFGLVLAVFSWIRSGICFPRPVVPALWREVVLCAGGGLAVAFWGPSTPLAWALGIWLFGLVQALFFVIFEPGALSAEKPSRDPFDLARHRIEELLDG